MAREFQFRHVYLRVDLRREEWMAGAEHLRPRRSKGLDCCCRVRRSEQRCDQCLRRYQQKERSAVLLRAKAKNRRLPWPGANPLVCGGVVALMLVRIQL